MQLTIGMATFDDFDGVFFTAQSLRLHQDLTDCEIIVVDNKPDSPSSRDLANFLAGVGARYVPMPAPTGTAPPRNRVFAEARGDSVLCLDSHVLLAPGAIARLKRWYADRPDTMDLFHGPILFDQLTHGATHFDNFWRGEMWGIWGQAWRARFSSELFGVLQDADSPQCRYVALTPGSPPIAHLGEVPLPAIEFAGHERRLMELGFVRHGLDPDDAPFEIPGQGLGLFTCRRDAWLGFNEHFRGFGGEELYIHEKYRQAGRTTWCLPFLAWHHRFGRPGGIKFPLTRWHKVRNYVLGARELDLDLAPIAEHFVTSGLLPRDQWEAILADPENETVPAGGGASLAPSRPMPPTQIMAAQDAAEGLLNWCTSVPRDLNEHLPKLAELASQCRHVTEFSDRRESTVGLLAGVVRARGKLISYQTESDALLEQMRARFKMLELYPQRSNQVDSIDDCDLLFLDSSPHNFDQVWGELTKFAPQVHRWIVLHDTGSYGPAGEAGGDGLWEVLKRWPAEHPEWFLAQHDPRQYGLTVLSRDPADRPEREIRLWPKGHGPGTELKALLKTLGIAENAHCDCNAKANQMDEWGVEGCRAEFDQIVGWMREGQSGWGWKDKLAAAAKAVTTGLAFQVNWSDPFPGLVRLAIDRAEESASGE